MTLIGIKPCIVAVDPGEATGVAVINWPTRPEGTTTSRDLSLLEGRPLDLSSLKLHTVPGGHHGFIRFWQHRIFDPFYLIAEKFEIRNSTAAMSDQDAHWRIVGFLSSVGLMYPKVIACREVAPSHHKKPAAAMVDKVLELPGVPQPATDHERDALSMLAWTLVNHKKGWMPEEMKACLTQS